MTDKLDEARMSAAVKLQRAFEREQQKSAASRKRGEEILNQAKKKQEDQKVQQTNEGTVQPSGTDKIEVAGNEVPAKQTKGKSVKSFKFFTTNESYTFDTAAMAKQELADAKNRKHRKRGKVANLLRKLGMKEEVEQIDERNKENALKRKSMDASRGARFKLKNPVPAAGAEHKTPQDHNKAIGRALRSEESEQLDEIRRDDAYTRDYKSSVAGMGSHKHSAAYHADGGANDEGWDDEPHHRSSHKPSRDVPHAVHINGKKWKSFGSHSHASNVAKKIKGATVHKEETIMPTKSLREFIETLAEAKPVNVDKVNTAGQAPHEEKWEAAKKPAVKKESFTAEELLVALKEGLWPGTPEHTAKFGDKYAQKQGGGAGVKKGYRYGGGAQKPDAEDDNDADDKPAKKPKNK